MREDYVNPTDKVIAIRVSEEFHRGMKIYCAEKGISMNHLARKLSEPWAKLFQ